MSFDDLLLVDDDEIIELVDVVEEGDAFFYVSDVEFPADEPAVIALAEVVQDEEFSVVEDNEDEDKDPLTTATLADIFISQGFYKRALKIYRDLADQNPDNESYRLKLLELKALIDEDEAQARLSPLPEDLEPGGAVAVFEPLAAFAGEAATSGNDSITVLEGWLDNIRRLRECRYGNC